MSSIVSVTFAWSTSPYINKVMQAQPIRAGFHKEFYQGETEINKELPFVAAEALLKAALESHPEMDWSKTKLQLNYDESAPRFITLTLNNYMGVTCISDYLDQE